MKGLTLIYSLLLLLMFGSCKQQDQPWENEEVAMVSFALSSPVDADSRGSVSTYPKDPSQWNENEQLADGRYFKDITVMILKDNVLQAFEDFNVTDKSAQVEISFSETFNAGTYTLMAVANYTHLNDFKTLLEGFKKGNKSYSELMSYRLSAGDDGLMDSKTVQPLTLIKEINLHPGQNQISGEMLRTYSRIRIEVRNQSDIYDLMVNGISFSDNFAQKEAYIWPGQGYLSDRRVAIDVYSNDALTPFTQSVTIPKMTASGGSTTVNSAVVFDAYIFESEETDAGKKYTYTLDLSYGGGQGGGGQTTVPEGPIMDVTSIRNYSTNTFLIQNVYSQGFLYDNLSNRLLQNTGLSLKSLKEEIAKGNMTGYLWRLEPYGTMNSYRIKNVATSNYIAEVVAYNQVNVSQQQASHYFRFYNYNSTSTDSDSEGIQMRYQDSDGNTCISSYYSDPYIGRSTLDGSRSNFVFYCMDNSGSNSSSDTGLKKIQPIDLRTINKETARPEDVRGIKRNDFINALVTVTYNETFGQFEFEVEDWNQAGGDITFN